MARKQIQKVRSSAHRGKYKQNLTRVRAEQERLTQQLILAQQTANTLRRQVDRTQADYDRAQQTLTQLRQANASLLTFCQNRLRRQTTAVNGLEAILRRGMGEPTAPQEGPAGGLGQ